MKTPSFHSLDRAVAIVKVVAFVGSIAYFLAVWKEPELEWQEFIVLVVFLLVFGVFLEGLQVVGLWRHKSWGFALVALWYVLGFLSTVFVMVVDLTTDVPMRPRQLFTWHDLYGLPIAAYCAYRYFTFERFEGAAEKPAG